MPFEEREVERITIVHLEGCGWKRHWGAKGSTIDWYARKEFEGNEYFLLFEAKGDIGPVVQNPMGQRLKYIQHALGQLVARTGPREYGYDGRTVLGVAFPAQCRDGSCYFRDTLRAKVADDLRAVMRLCLFFVEENGQVVQDIPSGVPAGLFT
jgi:hypothetical protein